MDPVFLLPSNTWSVSRFSKAIELRPPRLFPSFHRHWRRVFLPYGRQRGQKFEGHKSSEDFSTKFSGSTNSKQSKHLQKIWVLGRRLPRQTNARVLCTKIPTLDRWTSIHPFLRATATATGLENTWRVTAWVFAPGRCEKKGQLGWNEIGPSKRSHKRPNKHAIGFDYKGLAKKNNSRGLFSIRLDFPA